MAKTSKTILVVAAHPDDEVLGCAGAMAKHVASGDKVHVVFMADGESSRGSNEDIAARNKNADKAAKLLGVEPPMILALPDNKMDSLPLLEIVQILEPHIAKIKPDIIYTHHAHDLNIDHRLTHQAVMTACRPQPGFCVRRILCFEVPSSTEWQTPIAGEIFAPNWFVDISNHMKIKLKALKCYDSEMRNFPHARSYEAVEALAKWRGASVGVKAAEAFMLVRCIK